MCFFCAGRNYEKGYLQKATGAIGLSIYIYIYNGNVNFRHAEEQIDDRS